MTRLIHKDLYDGQRFINIQERRHKVNQHRREINSQLESNEFADGIINRTSIQMAFLMLRKLSSKITYRQLL
jgi:hypothetical protein